MEKADILPNLIPKTPKPLLAREKTKEKQKRSNDF
jgi:hypothetical protein